MIEIDAKTAQSTLDRLARINKDVEQKMNDFLKKESKILETKIKQELTKVKGVDTGQARNSIHGEVERMEGRVKANALHASIIEYGRRPGKFPPIEPIRRWVQRKGLNIPAFVVARKIAVSGVAPRPFFYPTWTNYKGTFNRHLIALFKQIVQK